MAEVHADLMYDPNDVGPDCVVRSRISTGPRREDTSFDPQIGDRDVLVDDDEIVVRGRVTARDGDRVWAQLDLQVPLPQSA